MINDEFDDLILKELIAEGLSDDALKASFEERKTQSRSAAEAMIADADAAAKGESEYYTMTDVRRGMREHHTPCIAVTF